MNNIKDATGRVVPESYQDIFRHKPKGLVFLDEERGLELKSNLKRLGGKYYREREISCVRIGSGMRSRVRAIPVAEAAKNRCPCCSAYSKGGVICDKCFGYDSDKCKEHGYHCSCSHCADVKRVRPNMSDKLLLGAELELNSISTKGKWFTPRSTLQYDASIAQCGGEIITSPMLYDEHVEFWSSMEEELKECDAPKIFFKKIRNPWHAKSKNDIRDTHGLHVHVNKVFLNEQKWRSLLGSVMSPLQKIATHIGGRPSGSYRLFPSTQHDAEYKASLLSNPAVRGSHDECFCPTNRTMEFRFCKSSTKVPVILGRIGMVESLVNMFLERDSHEWVTEDEYLKYLKQNRKRWGQTLWLARNNKSL